MGQAWQNILAEMAELDAADGDAEIVAEGLQVCLGDRRLHRRTLNNLLALTAVSDVSDVKGLERYRINEVGRALLRRPELCGEIAVALHAGGAWAVRDDRLVPLAPLTSKETER